MPKCPKCGDDNIDHLILLETKQNEYKATYDAEAETLEFENTEEWRGNPTGEVEKEEYSCPKCKQVIFTNEADAKSFLSTTSSPQEK